MAQLRDALTSELIADGSPEEIARIAEAFDPDDVLFDGVGAVDQGGRSLFNPAAVRKTYDDTTAGLETAIATVPESQKADLRVALQERRDRKALHEAKRTEAQERLRAARARVRGGR